MAFTTAGFSPQVNKAGGGLASQDGMHTGKRLLILANDIVIKTRRSRWLNIEQQLFHGGRFRCLESLVQGLNNLRLAAQISFATQITLFGVAHPHSNGGAYR